MQAYGRNSFVLRNPEISLYGSLLFAAAGFALFALNSQNSADPLTLLERGIRQRVPAQGTPLPEHSHTRLRLGMAAISAVVGFFVQGRLTMRDVDLPASFNYP